MVCGPSPPVVGTAELVDICAPRSLRHTLPSMTMFFACPDATLPYGIEDSDGFSGYEGGRPPRTRHSSVRKCPLEQDVADIAVHGSPRLLGRLSAVFRSLSMYRYPGTPGRWSLLFCSADRHR